MGEWYRNRTWDDDVAAEFESRLARARSQRTQYLLLQGVELVQTHPAVAIELLQRCVMTGDERFVAHAHAEMAHAHLRLGRVQEAVESLAAAVSAQDLHPLYRTSAPADLVTLVALHGLVEWYDDALALADRITERPFAVHVVQLEGARAVILHERGEVEGARSAAHRALAAAREDGWIPGHPEVGAWPGFEDDFSRRLVEIAGAS